MSDRIRIDSNEVARAPDVPQSPVRLESRDARTGEVFGRVDAVPGPQAAAGGGIWAKPKLLFAMAGAAAAIFASVMTDGIGGFGRAEAAGEEPSPLLALLWLGSFASLVTAFIAAADDLASGAFRRAALFGGLGAVLGLVGGAIALIGGGIAMMILQDIVLPSGSPPETELALVFVAMLLRTPAWIIAGILCGALVGALGRSMRRALLGAAGGAAGGLVGGIVFDPLSYLLGGMQPGSSAAASRFVGLLLMGSATGFAIAFAEQAAKQAWLAIERGRLIGKQFIIYRNPTRIGASYANDVFLFKDSAVLPEHAAISRRADSYQIEARHGALVRVNGTPVVSRGLASGDVVQIGETVMRFNTKA